MWFITFYANLLCIRFDKVNGFFSTYDGTRYLVLFDPEKYIIYKWIRCLISQETRIMFFSHNYAKMKNDSHNLPLEETLTFHVLILFWAKSKSLLQYIFSLYVSIS